ncbi:MAG: class I SAM-dependent methyltransferase [Solirubrobacteraceae bacterium]
MIGALRLYEDDLRDGLDSARPPQARFRDGTTLPLGLERWLGPADATDEQLLDRVTGPVLDVGCGPGRHLHALAARGVFALGVDLSPVAVELAVGRGGRAIVGDIFDELPGSGSWRSALLLDGNIGIGGSPARLLTRLRALLDQDGEILAEVEPPWGTTCCTQARLERGETVSGWFPWARVGAAEIEAIAGAGGFCTAEVWPVAGRWFARLRRAEPKRARARPAPARQTAGAGTVP